MANNKEDVIVPEFERPLIELESKITELKTDSNSSDPAIASQIKSLEQDAEILKQKIFSFFKQKKYNYWNGGSHCKHKLL